MSFRVLTSGFEAKDAMSLFFYMYIYREPDEVVGDIEEEGEGEVNMLNDSLLQVYRHDDQCTLTSSESSSAHSTSEGKVRPEKSGEEDPPIIINWDDSGVESSLMMSQGETPMGVTKGDNTSQSHVTSGDGHVTSVKQQCVEGGGVAVPCGSVEGGRGEEGREGAVESERKLKKVTFAPDVKDNQTTSILKVGHSDLQ